MATLHGDNSTSNSVNSQMFRENFKKYRQSSHSRSSDRFTFSLRPESESPRTQSQGNARLRRVYKICDFGLSRVHHGALRDSAPASHHGDNVNMNSNITGGLGTPAYMAPEVITSDVQKMSECPRASDVYAYSILAWMVLSGEKPYGQHSGRGVFSMLTDIVGGLRPQLRTQGGQSEIPVSFCPSWPPSIAPLLAECWSSQAADRPAFGHIIKVLRKCRNKFKVE